MLRLKKKYIVQIPENFQVFYCNTKNIIVFLKDTQKQVLNLKVKILFISSKNLIAVTDISHLLGVKRSKKVQGMTVSYIKHKFVEMSYTLFTKLKTPFQPTEGLRPALLAHRLRMKVQFSPPNVLPNAWFQVSRASLKIEF